MKYAGAPHPVQVRDSRWCDRRAGSSASNCSAENTRPALVERASYMVVRVEAAGEEAKTLSAGLVSCAEAGVEAIRVKSGHVFGPWGR